MTALAVSAYLSSTTPPQVSTSSDAGLPRVVRVRREVVLLRIFGLLIAVFMLGLLAVMCLAEAQISRGERVRVAPPEAQAMHAVATGHASTAY